VQLGHCAKAIPLGLLSGEHGEIWGKTRGGVGKSGVLIEHKSGNTGTFETRKDGGKVTMEALYD